MQAPAADISYQALQESDQPRLEQLMQRIYPPVYAHFWPDGGQWYLNSQYGWENFARELAQLEAIYRFVLNDGHVVGIVRTLPGLAPPGDKEIRATKLHRLYLDPVVHGCGIGQQVIEDVSKASRERGDELLWLEAMDSSTAALAFYERVGFERMVHFTLDMPRMYPARRGMWRLGKRW
ncbi:GNAT family N-acetyltransferase [Neolewinella litorea]|nr:GNAT family N-acetyltransferase [Neolewinella litorea]